MHTSILEMASILAEDRFAWTLLTKSPLIPNQIYEPFKSMNKLQQQVYKYTVLPVI